MVGLLEVPAEKINKLRNKLEDAATTLPEKYRVLFSLRNVAGPDAHAALAQGGARVCARGSHALGTLNMFACAAHFRDAETASLCPAVQLTRRTTASLPPPAALKDRSNLLRHDVAFCLGQRQDKAAVSQLIDILNDPSEHCM